MVRNITTSPLLVLAAVVVALALVIGASVWPSGQADAGGHGAMRSLSSSSVGPGEEITVTINATNLDMLRAGGGDAARGVQLRGRILQTRPV